MMVSYISVSNIVFSVLDRPLCYLLPYYTLRRSLQQSLNLLFSDHLVNSYIGLHVVELYIMWLVLLIDVVFTFFALKYYSSASDRTELPV